MDIAEKSFNFEQRITNQESNQDITYFVNGQEITAQVKDVRELTEEFKKYQDEAFSNSQFAIDRFEVEDFGGGVIVRAIPMYITQEDPRRLVSEIAYNLANGRKARLSEKMDWIFHSVACRSAIKAGDKAEITRLTRLVKDIRQKRIPLYCPHGRPVIITISKKEIEKQFGR